VGCPIAESPSLQGYRRSSDRSHFHPESEKSVESHGGRIGYIAIYNQRRVSLCDFIAGMTDDYAVEF
jgi:dGTP triphosphohydrolase